MASKVASSKAELNGSAGLSEARSFQELLRVPANGIERTTSPFYSFSVLWVTKSQLRLEIGYEVGIDLILLWILVARENFQCSFC